ncbi:MAG: Ger(x)C family spore germination C-terminal domain-containing protein [Clostridiales bacterium]|nr:Ger(x)C family spore germination C-terminal domain-containing protein [Clostridiales bacterium]
MSRAQWLLLAAAACAALAGCAPLDALPYAYEIEDTVLLRTLGVDVATQRLDGVAVTASSGERPAVGDSPGQAGVVLSAQADTVSAARTMMQSYGKDELFFGDVEQVVVGEGLAQRGLDDLLALMARDPELRLEARLWVVRGGSASDVLFGGEESGGVDDRLDAMESNADQGAATLPRTAREALVDLARSGTTFLPALAQGPSRPGDGAEGDTTVSTAGYALFRDGALCGWAAGEEAHGIHLLLGRADGGLLECAAPDGARVALLLTGVRTGYTPIFRGGALAGLEVKCKVEARLAEVRGGDALSREELAWLEAETARLCRTRMETALSHSRALEADYLNLRQRAALSAPWRKDELEQDWEEGFPGLAFTVNVQVKVAGG